MKTRIFFILLAALTLTSCVVPRNYSRAKEKVDRIVAKFPEILENDTIRLNDTLITPEVAVDTVFKLAKNDTIEIIKEKLRVKIVKGRRDTLMLEAECLPDTIFQKIKIPVYSIDPQNLKEKKFLGMNAKTWRTIGFGLLLGIIFVLIILVKRRRSDNG